MNSQELAATASAMVAPGKGHERHIWLPGALATHIFLCSRHPATSLAALARLNANVKPAQEALLYRAKCNRAAREGKYAEEMEMGEPALVGAEARHSHLASQD